MRDFLEEILHETYSRVRKMDKIELIANGVEGDVEKLAASLTEGQLKLFMNIGDGLYLSSELCNHESYLAGFKQGIKIGYG